MSILSENLRLARLLRGMSVRQIAQKVDRAPSTILNWEKGEISPDVDSVEKLCGVLQISPNQLMGWEPCPEIIDFKNKQAQALIELEKLKAQKSEIEQRIKEYSELISRNS